jgi:putative membrane protein (TIGR04086 family)
MNKVKLYFKDIFISFGMSILLLSLAAAIFTYTNLNDIYLDSFVFGIVMVSVLIGSTILSRKIKEKGIFYGALFGFIYCLIIYIFTALMYTGFFVSNTLGIYLLICVLSGMIGGIIGVNI